MKLETANKRHDGAPASRLERHVERAEGENGGEQQGEQDAADGKAPAVFWLKRTHGAAAILSGDVANNGSGDAARTTTSPTGQNINGFAEASPSAAGGVRRQHYRQQQLQRAFAATRIARAAEVLAGMNDQSVEFIIQRYVGREVALEELADVFVTESRVGDGRDAPGCGGCRRRRRRPDASRRRGGWSRRFPGRCRGRRAVDRATVVLGLETFCLASPGIPGGGNGRRLSVSSFSGGNSLRSGSAAETCREIFSMARGVRSFARRRFSMAVLDVGPRSVLDEDGADDDFKGGAAGPPVLGTMGGEEGVVVGACVEGRNLRQGVRGLETLRTIFQL